MTPSLKVEKVAKHRHDMRDVTTLTAAVMMMIMIHDYSVAMVIMIPGPTLVRRHHWQRWQARFANMHDIPFSKAVAISIIYRID